MLITRIALFTTLLAPALQGQTVLELRQAEQVQRQAAVLAEQARATAEFRRAMIVSGFTADELRNVPDSCKDLEVRLAALNALRTMDSTKVVDVLKRLFARRDACSLPLRQHAIRYGFIPRDMSPDAEALVISIATTDPDPQVRSGAINLLQGDSSEAAAQGLYKALRAFEDQSTQNAALSVLSNIHTKTSLKLLKDYIDDASTPEEMKSQALNALVGQYTRNFYAYNNRFSGQPIIRYDRNNRPYQVDYKVDSAANEARAREVAGYLRELFPKLPSESLKRQVLSNLTSRGDAENAAWLLGIAVDAKEPIDMRRSALSSAMRIPAKGTASNAQNVVVGQAYERSMVYGAFGVPSGPLALGVDQFVQAYDKLDDRQMKQSVVQFLSQRPEDAAFTKLAAIAKGDKDDSIRRMAVQQLSASKDPRAAKALSDVINQ